MSSMHICEPALFPLLVIVSRVAICPILLNTLNMKKVSSISLSKLSPFFGPVSSCQY